MGVGRKVADCVALFSLDQTSAIPVDTHVWNIACRYFDPTLRVRRVRGALHEQTRSPSAVLLSRPSDHSPPVCIGLSGTLFAHATEIMLGGHTGEYAQEALGTRTVFTPLACRVFAVFCSPQSFHCLLLSSQMR